MKATIYVPDDLWDRARQLAPPQSNPSQLVQDALGDWIRFRDPEPFQAFDQPDDEGMVDEALFQMQRLRREAQEAYGDGFAAGVKAADGLSWNSFEAFAHNAFDLRQWVEPMRDGVNRLLVDVNDADERGRVIESRYPAYRVLAQHLGGLVDPLADWKPLGVWLTGFSDALQRIRESVMSPTHVSKSGGVDGYYEVGGMVIHDEYGIGVVEAMRDRPSDDRLEALIRFESGKRRRFILTDALVGVPADATEELRRDPKALFVKLAKKRADARKEMDRLVPNARSGRAKLARLSDLASEAPDDKKDRSN